MTTEPLLRRREVPPHGPWPDSMPPLLQRIYAARGATSAATAELRLGRLLPPTTLGGIAQAAELLHAAIAADRHIVVVGDFDCDGATGTAVAVAGLRRLGARRVSYRVPHRIEHGYGLSPGLVEAIAPLAPDLLLTVDSGIACLAGVAAAKARGWQVLISDHHLPGERLPDADAIVDPSVPGSLFASKALAGVGVVFYLLLALRQRLREAGAAEVDLSDLLDLVAVGTVADMVPLDYNNRILVAAGLQRLRQGSGRPGLRALAEVAGRQTLTLSAADIGFALAPRLNAAGRLEDMTLGIECLLAEDLDRARELAATLDAINAERRGIQQQMVEQAEAAIAGLRIEGTARLPAAVCLFDPGWHPGVVGLVASKIKDRLHRPVVAFAPADESGERLRGSARSIPGFHIRDALAAVDARHPGLIERFGGHAMAAGLSLHAAAWERFGDAFVEHAGATLDPDLLRSVLWSDGPLAGGEFEPGLAQALCLGGPWGQGFPEPLFDNEFELLDWRVLGERHLKLTLLLDGRPAPLTAMHFDGWTGQPPPTRLRAAYQLDLDEYRGRRDVRLLIRHLQPL